MSTPRPPRTALFALLAAAWGCASTPSLAPVAPHPIDSTAAGPGLWTRQAHGRDLRAWTANVWLDSTDTDTPLTRFVIECRRNDRHLAVFLLTSTLPRPSLELPPPAEDTPADTDDEDNGSFLEQLVWAFLEPAIDTLLAPKPKKYVASTALWDDALQQDIAWQRPRNEDDALRLDLRSKDVGGVDGFLALLREHDWLVLWMEFRGLGTRRLSFDLRQRENMDAAVGAVLEACGRRPGLEEVP